MNETRRTLLACVTLFVCVMVLYGQVVGHEFVSYDDPAYFSENSHVTSGITAESVQWAFTSVQQSNWHPLTWLSYMAGVELAGAKPGPQLLINALLHAANAVLLFLVLVGYTGSFWRAFVAAALFAVHPLRVESVAWLSERKDVLSAFFWFLSLLAYRRYARDPRLSRLWPTALLLGLGLMAKSMLVTAPFVFVLLDVWPLNRLAAAPGGAGGRARAGGRGLLRLLLEKTPLVLLVAGFSWITFVAQRRGRAMLLVEYFSFPERCANAILSYARYVGKTLLPVKLSIFYPLQRADLSFAAVGAAAVLLVLGTAFALAAARRRPYLTVGWLWYVGMLVPVIGLVQVGGQALADRYTYLPQIGLLIIVVWGGADLAQRHRPARVLSGICLGAVLAALMGLTWKQVGLWRNGGTLFTHALQVPPRTSFALVNLALYHDVQGRFPEALRLYEEALLLNPGHAVANYNRGNLLIRLGRVDEGIEHLRRSLRSNPDSVDSLTNLGIALISRGEYDEAGRSFLKAVALAPGQFQQNYNMGLFLAERGRWEEAGGYYRKALSIDPGRTDVHNNLGIVLTRQGELQQAESQFREALRIDPGNRQARENLENLLRQRGAAP